MTSWTISGSELDKLLNISKQEWFSSPETIHKSGVSSKLIIYPNGYDSSNNQLKIFLFINTLSAQSIINNYIEYNIKSTIPNLSWNGLHHLNKSRVSIPLKSDPNTLSLHKSSNNITFTWDIKLIDTDSIYDYSDEDQDASYNDYNHNEEEEEAKSYPITDHKHQIQPSINNMISSESQNMKMDQNYIFTQQTEQIIMKWSLSHKQLQYIIIANVQSDLFNLYGCTVQFICFANHSGDMIPHYIYLF